MTEQRSTIRNYKDTVFHMLFQDPAALLSLYNAINGTAHTDVKELRVYTLENAIYMSYKNDVSFILDAELSLYEQQASFNPNMPLRNLIYVTKQFEKYIRKQSLYSSSQIKLPVPRFIVFYNGTGQQPERQLLKLSDAYEKQVEDPELELKVLMLNINVGHNRALLEKCRILGEYSQYVDCVRRYARNLPIEQAVEEAIRDCIRNNILADFLKSQRAEVVSMSIFEYNEEEEMRKIRQAEFDIGHAAGMKAGHAAGVKVGHAAGVQDGQVNDILDLLSDLEPVPEDIALQIRNEKNSEVLRRLLKAAARAHTLEEFRQQL
ncbi:MAG: hypothetical protein Q4C65_05650 [Eubacteriales bacterium]|nr:hypothetical protein [Eubacteriales bacterium]